MLADRYPHRLCRLSGMVPISHHLTSINRVDPVTSTVVVVVEEEEEVFIRISLRTFIHRPVQLANSSTSNSVRLKGLLHTLAVLSERHQTVPHSHRC